MSVAPPEFGTEAEAVLYGHEHGLCVLGMWRGIGVFFPNGPVCWNFVNPDREFPYPSDTLGRVCRYDPRWPGAGSIAAAALAFLDLPPVFPHQP